MRGSTAFVSFTKSSCSIADFGCTCRMEYWVSRSYSIMSRSFTIVVGPRRGSKVGHVVDIGENHMVDPARRWAVALDACGLVFVDSDQLAAE